MEKKNAGQLVGKEPRVNSLGAVEKTLGKAMAYNNELSIDGKIFPLNSTTLLGNPMHLTELHGFVWMGFDGMMEETRNMYLIVVPKEPWRE